MNVQAQRTAFFLFVSLTVSLPFTLLATTFVDRPMTAVVNEAQAIVRGVVVGTHVDYEPSGSGRIMTYTRVKIDEVLKGTISEKEVLVRQPGGAKDGMEMRVAGTAEFKEGEDVVLLLGPFDSRDQSYFLPGLATAKFNVERRKNGDEVLVNSLGSDEIYQKSKNQGELSYTSRVVLSEFRTMAAASHSANEPPSPPKTESPGATPASTSHNDSETETTDTPTTALNEEGTKTPEPKKTNGFIITIIALCVMGAAWFWTRRR